MPRWKKNPPTTKPKPAGLGFMATDTDRNPPSTTDDPGNKDQVK